MLEATEATVDPADPAAIMYSSGSTAHPKGAIHCQATVVRHPFQVNRNRGLVADDRVFIVMPFFWVGGFHHGLIAAYGAAHASSPTRRSTSPARSRRLNANG